MAGLVPAICTGTAAAKMAGSDPRIRSGDGHDGFAVTPRLPGESTFSALGIRGVSDCDKLDPMD